MADLSATTKIEILMIPYLWTEFHIKTSVQCFFFTIVFCLDDHQYIQLLYQNIPHRLQAHPFGGGYAENRSFSSKKIPGIANKNFMASMTWAFISRAAFTRSSSIIQVMIFT